MVAAIVMNFGRVGLGCRDRNLSPWNITLTDDISAVRELLQKGSVARLLREMIGFAAQQLMELETEPLCGAAHGERSADRLNQRNGYRERDWETRAGSVELVDLLCGSTPMRSVRPPELHYPTVPFPRHARWRFPAAAVPSIPAARVFLQGRARARASLSDPARPFKPWLNGIAERRTIDHLRKLGRITGRESTIDDLPEGVGATQALDKARMEAAELHRAVAALPASQR